MAGSLDGTVALVTGAGGGIGSATCLVLQEAGAAVIATDLSSIISSASRPAGAEYLDLDVTDEDAWTALLDRIANRYGRLDILVNNAGVSIVEKFEGMSLASWHKTMSVNVDGVFLGIRAAVPLLRKSGVLRKGGASVINVSSIAGLVGAPFNAAYCASKGAIKLMTKALALEFSTLGYCIRVNSIHPGGVDTPMGDSIFKSFADLGMAESAEAAYQLSARAHALGRRAKPEEIAAGIRYMASDEASNMHGAEMVLDGGFTAR